MQHHYYVYGNSTIVKSDCSLQELSSKSCVWVRFNTDHPMLVKVSALRPVTLTDFESTFRPILLSLLSSAENKDSIILAIRGLLLEELANDVLKGD